MKVLLLALVALFLAQTSSAEETEPIVLWGVYEPDIENIEIDPDSTWSHHNTYSFRVIGEIAEIRKVFVSSFRMEGAPDPWKKTRGLDFGDHVQISVERKYQDESIAIVPENGILYIYSDEFKILKRRKASRSGHSAPDSHSGPSGRETSAFEEISKWH